MAMSPQRRIALMSVAAALVLIGVKLVTGLATGSLGFLSEAAHSGTDLVAALLTLYAVRIAVRPADDDHNYGHGKAEHLAALAESCFLMLVSAFLAFQAVEPGERGYPPDQIELFCEVHLRTALALADGDAIAVWMIDS